MDALPEPVMEVESKERRLAQRIAGGAGLLLGGIALAGGVAHHDFVENSQEVTIGAHTTEVSPTFDGYATINFGGLIPKVRYPTDAPFGLGAEISTIDTTVGSLDELIQTDALIASQPEGEIAKLNAALTSMAIESSLKGGASGAAMVLGGLGVWRVVGRRRRDELRTACAEYQQEHPRLVGAGTALSLAAIPLTMGATSVIEEMNPEPTPTTWYSVTSLFPESVAADERLTRLEVSNGPLTDGARSLITSAFHTYNKSMTFYGELRDKVHDAALFISTPEENEVVAVLVSDRHNNIGMDQVIAAVGEVSHASILINAGDDTSSGGSWEAFSIDSLDRHTKDVFEHRIAVPGNHDYGSFVRTYLKEKGFTVLDGEPETIADIRFLGEADPRSSGYTSAVTPIHSTIEEQSEHLAKVACEDGEVSTLITHSPAANNDTIEQGCVELAVSGHMHRQIGPTSTANWDGSFTTEYTNGTTGGAAFSFALGSKLRRQAQITLLTYRDGHAYGIQPIDIYMSGEVEVQPFILLSEHEIFLANEQQATTDSPAIAPEG